MWNNIIRDTNDTGMFIFSNDAKNGSQARGHKWQPIPYHYHIGFKFTNLPAHLQPVERIDGIDAAIDI